ncbi:hypothetical protein COLO4_09863 [Corchorus olitorius]|uniref:Shugoshin C-terminal domain-containing protein n=1 Tax=Corchorus olitorius TaxID=93759 RepID=A0A1R3KAV4_9ROSI|nr:hypothetical protein COLO4_09863 [Corchorus olitorius]
MESGSLICNEPRKGLRDLTNFQQQPRVLKKGGKPQPQPASLCGKEFIDKLQQENMMLMKVLVDRNKVIESSGIELNKLRINLERFQQQNLLLAQANSQMLAELNAGKDKLKVLKHELACTNAVLNTMKSEARTKKCDKAGESLKEDGEDKPCNANSSSKAGESLKEIDGDNKPRHHANRRRQSKSLCPSNIKPVQAKEGVDNKRVCLRRQSARFRAEEPKLTEDAFDVDETNFIVSSSCDDKLHESSQSSFDSSVKKVHEEEGSDMKRVGLRRQSARFKAQESKSAEDAFHVSDTRFLVSSSCDEKVHGSGQASSDSLVKKEHEEGSINNKRVCLRRQSARFKSQEPKLIEVAFDVDDKKLLVSSSCDDKACESGPISSDSSIKKEDEEGSYIPRNEALKLRTSVGRPLRRAVEKVQTYKEIPLNVKMRREV